MALVVLPALFIVGLAGRNTFALWLGIMLLVAVITPAAAVLLRLTDSPMVMNNAVPILLLSVVGALWLARSSVEQGPAVAVALVLGLLASIPWTFTSMESFPRQGIERAFHDAVATGESQEGAITVDGTVVGYAHERDMADFITAHVREQDAVLTDNAATYAVMLLTGRPDLFFDRVDQSDGPWGEAARDPGGEVQYLLLSTETQRDLLSQLYPAASSGNDPVLSVVHGNDRYTLVSVPATTATARCSTPPTTSTGTASWTPRRLDATRPTAPKPHSAPRRPSAAGAARPAKHPPPPRSESRHEHPSDRSRLAADRHHQPRGAGLDPARRGGEEGDRCEDTAADARPDRPVARPDARPVARPDARPERPDVRADGRPAGTVGLDGCGGLDGHGGEVGVGDDRRRPTRPGDDAAHPAAGGRRERDSPRRVSASPSQLRRPEVATTPVAEAAPEIECEPEPTPEPEPETEPEADVVDEGASGSADPHLGQRDT